MERRAILLWLLGATPAARASTIASWWVKTDDDYSPQLFKYNDTTGKIYGSLCNSVTTPVFAQNDSTALNLTIAPSTGSNIASLGYLSDDVLQVSPLSCPLDSTAPLITTPPFP